jgi:hypothetical protein
MATVKEDFWRGEPLLFSEIANVFVASRSHCQHDRKSRLRDHLIGCDASRKHVIYRAELTLHFSAGGDTFSFVIAARRAFFDS